MPVNIEQIHHPAGSFRKAPIAHFFYPGQMSEDIGIETMITFKAIVLETSNRRVRRPHVRNTLVVFHNFGAKIPAKKLLITLAALAICGDHRPFALYPVVLIVATCSAKADDIAHAATETNSDFSSADAC